MVQLQLRGSICLATGVTNERAANSWPMDMVRAHKVPISSVGRSVAGGKPKRYHKSPRP